MDPKIEKAFGIIPLNTSTKEVFMIQHAKGEYWGFPKGHKNPGERPEDTAERELLEETGFELVKILSLREVEESYQFYRDNLLIEKHVCYFFGEITGNFRPQPKEVLHGKWVKASSLLAYAIFEGQKKLFNQLNLILNTM